MQPPSDQQGGQVSELTISLACGLLPDVAAALDCDVADVTLDTIRRGVEDRRTEFEQLDCKWVYPANGYGRSEIAKDVAALVNARRGLVVVGGDDDDDAAPGT